MKIVIAPDSFKENLTSLEVASELEAGFRRVWPDADYVKVPMADGGEGTVQSLVDATGGRIVKCAVTGPLGQKVLASYGILGDGKTAVIEMAEASGLPLVPKPERDPLRATTFGTGELVSDAIHRGVDGLRIRGRFLLRHWPLRSLALDGNDVRLQIAQPVAVVGPSLHHLAAVGDALGLVIDLRHLRARPVS